MQDTKFLDERSRFEQTPDRYNELANKKTIIHILESLSQEWKNNKTTITYLDVGCGNGVGTKKFADFLLKTTSLPVTIKGIDASEKCLNNCLNLGVDFSEIDLNSKPFPGRNYDIITLFETIEHIYNTDFLLNSIKNSLAQDGILLITTLNVVCWKNRILVPLGIQPFNTEVSTQKLSYGYRLNFLKKRMDTWKPAGHIRPFTLPSLCDLLEDNGFEIVQTLGLENWKYFKLLEKISKNMCTGILVACKLK